MGLIVGPGFQAWIDAHQATPLQSEDYHDEGGDLVYSTLLVLVGAADGVTKVPIMLYYVASTNQVYELPFDQTA